MRKFSTLFLTLILLALPALALDTREYLDIVKITKKMNRLADKNKIEELGKYYSENYISFDGYNKETLLEIYKNASKLYPNSKTKETILNVEQKGDTVKVYIDEKSFAKTTVTGKDAMYATADNVKGRIYSTSNYALIFKKENNDWKVIGDEIFTETTDIRYGDAIGTGFSMELPEKITPKEEFTVKMTVLMPMNRIVVGSIGHDEIIFPPKKGTDPFRTINETGVLERVMIANKNGKNEYVNSTFTFITPTALKPFKFGQEINGAISGMGVSVRRVNMKNTESSEL